MLSPLSLGQCDLWIYLACLVCSFFLTGSCGLPDIDAVRGMHASLM